jgi:CheY-like chemotaxis protein
VTAASRGGIALNEHLEHLNDFDALITDVRMPGIDGDELVRLFRKERRNLPVIYISGHSFRSIEENHNPAQPTFFLQKPFSTDELSRSLEKLLQMKS